MLINNPERLQARMNAPRRHKCLKYRATVQLVVDILFWVAIASIATVVIHKSAELCPVKQPYVLCVANHHCAYITKGTNRSFVDHLPFLSDNNMCVSRSDFPRGLGSLTERGTNMLNNLFQKVNVALNAKARTQLLADFHYEYDEVVFYGITRYEIGLWLLFCILAWLRRELRTMGDPKTIFDFMRPNAAYTQAHE